MSFESYFDLANGKARKVNKVYMYIQEINKTVSVGKLS